MLRDALNGAERRDGRTELTGAFPEREGDQEAWISAQREWGVPAETAKGLGMPTRVYCARVLKVDVKRGHGKTLALIAESEEPTGIVREVIEQGFTRPFFEAIINLSQTHRELIEKAEHLEADLSHSGDA